MCKDSENPQVELLSSRKQLYDSIWQMIPRPRTPSRWAVPLRLCPLRMARQQESAWSGSLSAPRPHAFGSFVHYHSVLRSAAATRVLHLTVMGSLSDGGCTDASSMLACIGFRRSSSITILALRKPDAHRRCSATPDGSPWHTRCLC